MPNNWAIVSWNGTITTSITNTYYLHYAADDGLSISLDGTLLTPISSTVFSISLDSNRTYSIIIQFHQFFSGSYLNLTSNDTQCCSFTSPVWVTVLSYDFTDIPPQITQNDATIDFIHYLFPFNQFSVAKWSGFLLPPVEYSNQWITLSFQASNGVAMYIDDELVIDAFWFDGPKSRDVFIEPGTVLGVTIKAYMSLNGGYIQFLWGLAGSPPSAIVPASALFITRPAAELKGDIVVNASTLSGSLRVLAGSNVTILGDLSLDDLYIQAIDSILTVTGSLKVIHQIQLGGYLKVEGSLLLSNNLTIDTLITPNDAPFSLSNCFQETSSAAITLKLSPTIQPNIYHPIINYNCPPSFFDNNPIQFEIEANTERDNTWDCNGAHNQYQIRRMYQSIGVLVATGKECGVGVVVVSSIGGVIIFLSIILSIYAIYNRMQRDKKMDRKISALRQQTAKDQAAL
eukprot:TRINITY_DN13717_c0_g1_i1.p1 TRINITY_DN13717_c0_g1~~TRINITY_DN13717_c0_g1_i1.p1  ORF type:complete len:458 (+),score=115.82 TRINITY_DN13717_c0_g1_i1:280-1653(+)